MAIGVSYISAWASNANAYKVEHTLDVIYYGFNRFLLTLGSMAVLFNGFMGHFNSLERTFLNDYTRGIARTSFTIGLVTPIVICLFNLTQENAIYLTGPGSQVFAIGNLVSNLLTGFFVFVFVEYQLHSLMNVLFSRHISHFQLLRGFYSIQQAEQRVSGNLAD